MIISDQAIEYCQSNYGKSIISATREELMNIPNMSLEKVEQVLQMFDKLKNGNKTPTSIKSSHNAFQCVKQLEDIEHEEFYAIYLDRAHNVISVKKISQGGIAGTVVDPKLVMKGAILCTASAIILAHNHPSGNNNPSKADIDITKKLVQGGKALDINVLDHIIVHGYNSYLSFMDSGIMPK